MSKITRAVVYLNDGRIVTFQSDNIAELDAYLKEVGKSIRSIAVTETVSYEEYMQRNIK
jgi:hypothetical protein